MSKFSDVVKRLVEKVGDRPEGIKAPGSGHQEAFKIKGVLEQWLKKPDGTVEYHRSENIIVDVGFDLIADVIGLTAQPVEVTHCAIGTGTTAAAATDTTLETELVRKTTAYTHTASTKVFQFETTFLAGEGTGTITEAGLFNNVTAGVMLDRVTFAAVGKAAADELTQRFTFTMT